MCVCLVCKKSVLMTSLHSLSIDSSSLFCLVISVNSFSLSCTMSGGDHEVPRG